MDTKYKPLCIITNQIVDSLLRDGYLKKMIDDRQKKTLDFSKVFLLL